MIIAPSQALRMKSAAAAASSVLSWVTIPGTGAYSAAAGLSAGVAGLYPQLA